MLYTCCNQDEWTAKTLKDLSFPDISDGKDGLTLKYQEN